MKQPYALLRSDTMADDIQKVIDTLQTLNIPATFNNLNHLLGCLQLLAEIRDKMRAQEANIDA